jgi:hypothetical protein
MSQAKLITAINSIANSGVATEDLTSLVVEIVSIIDPEAGPAAQGLIQIVEALLANPKLREDAEQVKSCCFK